MCVARQKRRQNPTDGIDGATSVAQTSGGGGTSSDMPWRDKDEDYLHWAYRAMRYAHAKHYPGNKLKKEQKLLTLARVRIHNNEQVLPLWKHLLLIDHLSEGI